MQGKNTTFGAGYVGLNRRSSGRLGREEVDIGLEEQSEVESSGCVWNSENKNKCTLSENTTVLLDVNERHVSAYLAIIRLQSSTTLNTVCVWRMLRSHHLAKQIVYEI